MVSYESYAGLCEKKTYHCSILVDPAHGAQFPDVCYILERCTVKILGAHF